MWRLIGWFILFVMLSNINDNILAICSANGAKCEGTQSLAASRSWGGSNNPYISGSSN